MAPLETLSPILAMMLRIARLRKLAKNPALMPSQPDIRAAQVSITKSSLVVDFKDGRSLSVPLTWFPDLAQATAEQLADHRVIGDGVGIHWETLGIDLSVPGQSRQNMDLEP